MPVQQRKGSRGIRQFGRQLACTVAPLALMLAVAGCNSAPNYAGGEDLTNALNSPDQNAEQIDKATKYWSKKYAEDPKDKKSALSLARILRAQGKKPEAVIIMRQAAAIHPNDPEVFAELGKALADSGRPDEALEALGRAQQTGGAGDWRTLSAYGTVLDQLERHKEARAYYERAMKLEPEEPAIQNNLALSYALDKNLPQAELILRRAAAKPNATREVKENFALVLGLQGKFEEAEQVARDALPQQEATSNVSYLKQMLSQPAAWAKMEALESKNRAKSQ